MRVVIVCDFGEVTGGAAQVAITSARGLADADIAVTFVCAIPPISDQLDHPNIAVHCLNLAEVWAETSRLRAARRGVWDPAAAARLRQILADCDPTETVVHFHQWSKAFSPSVLPTADDAGLASIMTLHDYFLVCPNGNYFDFPRGQPCTVQPMSPACALRNCDSRSRAHKAVRLVRQLGIEAVKRRRRRPLNVIHVSRFAMGIAQTFLPPDTRHFVVPNLCVLPKGPRIAAERNTEIVFLGRFTREKACAQTAEAAARAAVPVTFLGAGPEEAAIRRANPAARILPWGTRGVVDAVLAQARAVVYPSLWYETNGMAVLEALSKGVPAVVSRTTGAAESITHGETGWIVEPGDTASLAAAFSGLRDDTLVTAFSRRAYDAFWRGPHTVPAHIATLIDCYERLLNQPAQVATQ